MKGPCALVRATMLEIACDPLALLMTLAALALATFAGALHYHQFGEPSRMAREAGLSAILVPGLAFCIFSTVRTLRREIESGTVQMALAHSLSRGAFLLAKLAGVAVAYLVFFLTVWASSLTAVRGAELGAAAARGDIARVWGPSFAWGVAPLVAAPVLAALLNRFARVRFVRAATLIALGAALAGACYRLDPSLALRQLGATLPLLPPALFFIALAGAAAVRLRSNAAASLAFAVAALALPVFGAHYLPDALEKGGVVPWGYLAATFAAALPLTAAALLAGVELFKGRDAA